MHGGIDASYEKISDIKKVDDIIYLLGELIFWALRYFRWLT